MASNKIIEVKDLSVSFGDRQVLKNVAFEVYDEEITVILGGSGAGKSVLMKHLLGLFQVPDDSVFVLGQNISTLDENAQKQLYLRLGVFYQNGGLLNSLTVAENIALPLEQHTNLDDELINQIVQTKLSLVNLPDASLLYPSQLSGGMLKRAALARAIVMDPELLFCDEPGAGLDPVLLASLDKLILDLRKQLGMSVIIVTHEIPSILRIADRILFLDNGELVFRGTLDEALDSDVEVVNRFFDTGRVSSGKSLKQ